MSFILPTANLEMPYFLLINLLHNIAAIFSYSNNTDPGHNSCSPNTIKEKDTHYSLIKLTY